ncbi:glycosyltransferase [Aquibaculum arenosum]|uniref:Glycosyltransferase n=1 Tax=Aquibaculum arenosum TaxID=3032591 RepID=A0ABT5YMI2_9PROT|nr:glycosyltransferase [Fodinicurvata sp. CAU 1616]MDF2096155.1 glycosyltransferase [Fodinicurvata sp. CAU 1616]
MKLSVDHIFKTLWNARTDLRRLSQEDPRLFREFVTLRINSEYPALKPWLTESLIHEWDQDKADYEDLGEWPRLNGLIYAVWASRPDLQKVFQLQDPAGRQRLSDWFILHGLQELQLAPLLGDRLLSQLNKPVPESHPAMAGRQSGDPPLTRLMLTVWERRNDVRRAFPMETPAGYEDFLSWYYIIGAVELGHVPLIHKDRAAWLTAPVTTEGRQRPHRRYPKIPYWLANILRPSGLKLKKAWSKQRPLTTAETEAVQLRKSRHANLGLEAYPRILVWLSHHLPDAPAKINEMSPEQARSWIMTDKAAQAHPVLKRIGDVLGPPSLHPAPSIACSSSSLYHRPFGLNLIGYARGQFGIGEDVRMAVRACQAAGIPFSVYNIDPGAEVTQDDQSIDAHISSERPYQINLFCTTGIETALLLARHGQEIFEDHYNIGYWPWELPQWPEAWHHAYELVDEVWASSRFAYNAYRLSAPVPVRHMPMAVTVEQTESLSRLDFGLPARDFLFVFGFDFLSHATRKNPYAAIDAFRRAFPRGDEAVGLVIKVMRAGQRPEEWRKLQQVITADSRIRAIAGTLSRGALLDLYRACDAFVSLHRSEGFGRNIAEAMALRKPVIVTGYSGNMDFTNSDSAALVKHRLVKLEEGDYPFGEGLEWAEPDVDHAAELMARLVADADFQQRLAVHAQQNICRICHPDIIGANYRYVLEHLVKPGIERKR